MALVDKQQRLTDDLLGLQELRLGDTEDATDTESSGGTSEVKFTRAQKRNHRRAERRTRGEQFKRAKAREEDELAQKIKDIVEEELKLKAEQLRAELTGTKIRYGA